MEKQIYRALEERTYDSKASQESRDAARISLATLFPEEAITLFTRRRDNEGLRYISQNPALPPKIRRNAYLERGFQVSVEDLEAGKIPGTYENTPQTNSRKTPEEVVIEEMREAHWDENEYNRLIEEQREARWERFEGQRAIARQFRRDVGLSENEYNRWLKQEAPRTAGAGFSNRINRNGEEMHPWQEVAYSILEG